MEFQSTRPVWGATISAEELDLTALFQSTRPVWGATQRNTGSPRNGTVSIHAPRVGRDFGEGFAELEPNWFQSTRPVWGATPDVM